MDTILSILTPRMSDIEYNIVGGLAVVGAVCWFFAVKEDWPESWILRYIMFLLMFGIMWWPAVYGWWIVRTTFLNLV